MANENGIIPRDDTYLTLKEIDVPTYKNSGINRLIYRDYTLNQISKLMTSKQADLIQRFVLMPQLFDRDTMMKNLDFYEKRCIHDFTLSLSAYEQSRHVLRKPTWRTSFSKGLWIPILEKHQFFAAKEYTLQTAVAFGKRSFLDLWALRQRGRSLYRTSFAYRMGSYLLCLNWRGSMLKITLENGKPTGMSTNGTVISIQEKTKS